MKLPVREEALVELDEAMAYYESERPGLGLEFLDAVEDTIRFAAQAPDGGERRGDDHLGRQIRRFVVSRFPFLVYVATVRDHCEVIAIAHSSRRPGYWRERSH